MTEPAPQTSKFSFWHNGPFALVARLAVALPFLYLSLKKLEDPPLFVKSLGGYDMIPTHPVELINSIAIFMPWAELLIGICLLVGILPRGAAFVAFAMLVAFTGAVAIRGLGIMHAEQIPFTQVAFDCGCGTGVVQLWSKLLANCGMILAAFYLCVSRARLWRLLSFEGGAGKGARPAYATEAA